MSEAVLDASVVLKWFHAEGERNVEAARRLRLRFEAGALRVLAPPLLFAVFLVARDKKLMQGQPSSLLTRSVVLLTSIVMTACVVGYCFG